MKTNTDTATHHEVSVCANVKEEMKHKNTSTSTFHYFSSVHFTLPAAVRTNNNFHLCQRNDVLSSDGKKKKFTIYRHLPLYFQQVFYTRLYSYTGFNYAPR